MSHKTDMYTEPRSHNWFQEVLDQIINSWSSTSQTKNQLQTGRNIGGWMVDG